MLTPKQKRAVNHTLNSAGLAGLSNPRELLAQLAMGIRTHKQFRDLLMKVVPEERYNCYHSLKSFLHIEPKSLDDYIADARTEAEEQRLPAHDPATGKLTAYEDYNPTRKPLERLAQEAIAAREREEQGKHRLGLTCRRCTFVEYFYGQEDRKQSYKDAAVKGWTFDRNGKEEKALCPKCSASHQPGAHLKRIQ